MTGLYHYLGTGLAAKDLEDVLPGRKVLKTAQNNKLAIL